VIRSSTWSRCRPARPNLNLIVRKKAFTRWRPTFEAKQEAASDVLDQRGAYRDESAALMTKKFQRHPKARTTA